MGLLQKEAFFMRKFDSISDESLVLEVKKHDIDAQKELIERYKRECGMIAKSFYYRFKDSTIADYDDFYNTALASLFLAASSFTSGKFKSYWKTIAGRNIQSVIIDCSNTYFISTVATGETDYFAQEDDYSNILEEDLIKFIKNPKNNFSEIDINIFILFLNGKTNSEIAKTLNISNAIVSIHLSKIRERLQKLLIHS